MPSLIREAIAAVGDEASLRTLPEQTFQFGELHVRLRMHEQGQAGALLRSIQHRRVDANPLAATIDVLGGPQARLEHLLPPSNRRDQRFLHDDGAVYLFWAAEGYLTLFDHCSRRGLVWYLSPDQIPSWEMGRPFLPLIKALSMTTAWTPVHAAAVAHGQSGVLILGHSNAGKSSTALACVEAGWRYVGDDCVLLSARPPRVASLYLTARVRADMFQRLTTAMSATERLSTDSGEVRAEIDVSRLKGAEIGDAKVSAIILPERNEGARASISPLSKSRALRALSATTLVMLPGAPVSTHEILGDVVQQVPCYTVHLGADTAAVPAILAQLVN